MPARSCASYFASPIAYIIIGLFALLFGWFFRVYLTVFAEQSQRMAMGGGGNMNVNEHMIRGVLQNAAMIILFVMPMITMRTYSEEKRSGTIELLLTSPLTDFADHPRQVPRRDGALCRDAARHDASTSRSCSGSATPSGSRSLAGYLGLLLLGGCFISVGLLISSLTKNQIVAGVHDVRGVPDALGDQLVRATRSGRPGRRSSRSCRSPITSTTSRKGIIDTKHLVYYLSFITFGLFLTAKSVDSERWRG